MDVIRVSVQEYKQIVPDRRVFFNEPKFCELNREKVDEVLYLVVMRDQSAHFGLILGKTGNAAACPFSAPYAYPVAIKANAKMRDYDEALEAIERFCGQNGITQLHFTFPPLFYDEHQLSGWINTFYRSGYQVANLDLSYALNLKKLNVSEEEYERMVPEKGRKSFRKARKKGLEIVKCETEEDYVEAYRIITIGHAAKGFPVKLSYEQLRLTLSLVDHEAFIVKNGDASVVAEVLYHINEEIVQGIYTGTHPDYMDCNGMNLLTYYTIRYYGDRGFRILDKATATENSVPNYGLCDFKESVGCERSLKYTFRKQL